MSSLLQCNVLLGNSWVLAFMWTSLDAQHLSQTKNLYCHTTKTAQEWLEEHNKVLKSLTSSPESPDPNSIEHLWDMPEQVWSSHPLGLWVAQQETTR